MDDNIRRTVIDPLGKAISLYENQFIRHIIGDHEEKDAFNRAIVERQAKNSIIKPRFIVKDQNYEGRRKYLDLVDVPEGDGIKIKSLTVVVDDNDRVVTWILKRTITDFLPKGDMFYDSQMV